MPPPSSRAVGGALAIIQTLVGRVAPETAKQVRQRRTPREFNEEDELKALELAAKVGRTAACARLQISKTVLQSFMKRHPEEWSNYLADRGTDFGKAFAAQLEDLAENYTAAEQIAVTKALALMEHGKVVTTTDGETGVENLDARDVAALIKALGSSRGGAAANARQSRGEPDKTLEVTVNFPALEAAAEQILQRAPAQHVLNEAEPLSG